MPISPPCPSTFGRRLIASSSAFRSGRDVHAGALQERGRAAVLLGKEGGKQVLGLDEAGVVGEREALGVGERLLEFGGELVDPHGPVPSGR